MNLTSTSTNTTTTTTTFTTIIHDHYNKRDNFFKKCVANLLVFLYTGQIKNLYILNYQNINAWSHKKCRYTYINRNVHINWTKSNDIIVLIFFILMAHKYLDFDKKIHFFCKYQTSSSSSLIV